LVRLLQLMPTFAAETADTRQAEYKGHAVLLESLLLECNTTRAYVSASTRVLKIGSICNSKSFQIGHPDGPNMHNQA